MRSLVVPLVLGWSALTPAKLFCQAVGSITGIVLDPSRAAVVSAKVVALEKSTSFTRTATTSQAGTYTLSHLAVGSYTVSAEAAGFTLSSQDVTLDVDQKREVNFTLTLSGVESKVEVTTAAPTIDTVDGTLGGLVSGQQVVTLPLNGRDITALVLLQPGVNLEVDGSWPATSNPNGNTFIASNGNRGTTGASSLDGLDTSDNELGGAQFTNFNLDAIAEFRVLQNNYSAEYGRGAGTMIQLVSKSGTNDWHGSVFEYLRNDKLDARNFFAKTVPPFKRNEYGGTFGGPIRVPGLYNGKDKTFFFFQYAAFRQVLGEPILLAVPTAEERQGIVNITGANGKPDQLIIPVNAVAAQVLKSYPLPNEPNGPLGARTFNFQTSVPYNADQWSTRIDHRFSDKDHVFFRISRNDNEAPLQDPQLAVFRRSFSSSLGHKENNTGGTETHLFTPTLLNTFRFAYTETDDPWQAGQPLIPLSTFTDGGVAQWGPSAGCCHLRIETYLFNDTVSWTKGPHTMTTGIEFRRVNDDGPPSIGLQGQFLFEPGQPLPFAISSASGQDNLAAGAPSPSSLVSFLVGAPTAYTRNFAYQGFQTANGGLPSLVWRRYHYNGWFQDDVRISNSLTLNVGLRYEYNTVPYEIGGRAQGIVDVKDFQGGTLFRKYVLNPSPIYRPDYNGWGPRFGFAYKLNTKTVLRGGFGIFTNLPLTQTADQQGIGSALLSIPNPTFQLTPLSATPISLVDLQGNPVPAPGQTYKSIKPNTPINLQPLAKYFGSPLLFNLSSLTFHNGYTMAGNFTIERELPMGSTLQVAYVTNDAVGLYASEWPNAYLGANPKYTPYSAATPGLGEFQLTDNHAHSTYYALQSQFRKNTPTHGLQFQVSYTYSKAIDNATSVFNGPVQNSAVLQNNPLCWRCEKAVSAFDFPHRFVTNVIYAIPLDKWQALPKRLRQGWQATSIFQIQSGFPFTVYSPYGTVEYGTDGYVGTQATRPDLTQQPTIRTGAGPEEQFFSTDVVQDGKNLGQKFFGTPGVAQNGIQDHPGDLGRNTFRSHGWRDVDFSLIKDTHMTEKFTLQFRSEFFNILNLHDFNAPGAQLGSASFGFSTSTVQAERQIQFALRLFF